MNIKHYALFWVEKQADHAHGKLRFKITWDGHVVSFNLGYRVSHDKWCSDTQRCRINTTHGQKKIPAAEINKEIAKYEAATDETFRLFEQKNKVPDASMFRDEFNSILGKKKGKSGKNFFDYFNEFILTVSIKNTWTEGTKQRFEAVKTQLNNFDKNLSFDDFSEDTFQNIINYMLSTGLRNTTISKNISLIRWFLRWAHNKGYYTGNAHTTFKPRLKGTDGNSKKVIYLKWDELIKLYNFKFDAKQKYLEHIRDSFCFCCFTSLRYSDLAKLKRSDVTETHITVVTQKTVDGLKIELNKYSKAILDKYKDVSFPNDLALPIISNQKMNDYLKAIGEIAEINSPQRIVYFKGNNRIEEVYPKYKLLTTHCGRRTFIVNALYLGIPAEVVMKWTGHNDYKAMKPYIEIVDELRKQEMNKFNLR